MRFAAPIIKSYFNPKFGVKIYQMLKDKASRATIKTFSLLHGRMFQQLVHEFSFDEVAQADLT